MPQPPIPESPPSGGPADSPRRAFVGLALTILWPAFFMAGALEALVFVVVDPGSLQWYGVEPLRWTTSAVYSVTFFIFWGAVATSAAITELLRAEGPAPERV
ncbi:MAG TPA: hypothetical protein VGQ91_07970 [Ideonella sp.]|jgi:hypothetical protein|nr:hypothetical protein [Ideonella sp.]